MEVTRELVLPAPPEEVWDALTDPERLKEWFANDVEWDGDELVYRWDDGEERRARIDEAEDPDKEISLYVNSPGGSAYAGMAIYDTMQHVKPDVKTICLGMGMSAAAMILCGGAAGKRFALPNAKIMIHQGSGGFRGNAPDAVIQLGDGNPTGGNLTGGNPGDAKK